MDFSTLAVFLDKFICAIDSRCTHRRTLCKDSLRWYREHKLHYGHRRHEHFGQRRSEPTPLTIYSCGCFGKLLFLFYFLFASLSMALLT